MTSIQNLQVFVKSSIFDRYRELTINSNYVEFDDHDLNTKPPTKFSKDDVQSVRYGVKWIEGYRFTIGRIYCVDIRSRSNRIIRIRLKSVYGIRRKVVHDKYIQIVNALYDNILDDLIKCYLTKFREGIDFELAGISFSQSGLKLNANSKIIPWDSIETAAHRTYYTIFPKNDPKNYKSFEFLNDWDAVIVYSVSRQILVDKGLYQVS